MSSTILKFFYRGIFLKFDWLSKNIKDYSPTAGNFSINPRLQWISFDRFLLANLIVVKKSLLALRAVNVNHGHKMEFAANVKISFLEKTKDKAKYIWQPSLRVAFQVNLL